MKNVRRSEFQKFTLIYKASAETTEHAHPKLPRCKDKNETINKKEKGPTYLRTDKTDITMQRKLKICGWEKDMAYDISLFYKLSNLYKFQS